MANFDAGEAYFKGEGCKVNKEKALAFYKVAADAKYPPALYRVGRMIEGGEGGATKDTSAAVAYFKQAAELNEPKGCMALGSYYFEGKVYP